MGSEQQSQEGRQKQETRKARAVDRGEAVAPVSSPQGALLRLQQAAGNRAAAQAVHRTVAHRTFVQRTAAQAEELRDAIEGLGTDEDTVFRVLRQNRGSEGLRLSYRALTSRSLESDLRGDLSGDDLDYALRLYFGHDSAEWDAAKRLKDAIHGAGTDEATVFEVLRSRTSEDSRTSLRSAYSDIAGSSLRSDIQGDFSGDELREAMLAYEVGPLTPDLEDAIQLRDAMSGLGTNEETVYRVLEARESPAALDATKAAYLELTGRTLEADVQADFADDEAELNRALQLLGLGTFENELPQDMFEGKRTVVRGAFDWRLEAGELKIDVNVNFVPDSGVTAPVGAWQGQISSVWNQYQLVEPGGLNIPINMSLVNGGSGKTIRVVENANPGSYGPPDRANAGKWYPVMRAATAPHEFGHLIGLPDEYQRSHDDFEDITGSTPTGPENNSGKTEAEIAVELNTALTGADEATRASDATTVLTAAGLIASNQAQQGDFAQSVMEEYDDAFSPSLQDTLAGLPRSGRWMLQSVFSYASGTVMGNPGIVPHEHPVNARHLREFVNIAQARFPNYEWSTGPR